MMEIKELIFSFRGADTPTLKNISFDIPAGKITSVIGPNGSGKSTLFRNLTGQYPVSGGEVYLQGKPISSYSGRERAKRLTMVYQHHPNITGVTVRELIESGRTPHHPEKNKREQEEKFIQEILAWTDLTSLQSKKVEKLSGGQKQRVWLAQAMAQQPDVLLLDEPNTFLDIEYQVELLQLLKELNQEKGLTIGMIMHDLTQVMDISDQVIALKDGEIFTKGTPKEVLTEENIEALFGVKTELVQTPSGNTLIHYLRETDSQRRIRTAPLLRTQ